MRYRSGAAQWLDPGAGAFERAAQGLNATEDGAALSIWADMQVKALLERVEKLERELAELKANANQKAPPEPRRAIAR